MASEQVSLVEAYEIAFGNVAGIQVLRDLNTLCGFHSTWPTATDPMVLVDHNAARRVFGRIYEILSATELGREAMAEAFRLGPIQE